MQNYLTKIFDFCEKIPFCDLLKYVLSESNIKAGNRVRNSWGRVSNLPLLLAEEGSQITTFGGRRVPNFSFLTENFWREKGLKSLQIGGRRVSNEDFTPLKVAV